MEVKGTAVKSIPDFVRAKHAGRYDDWFKSLSLEAAGIIKSPLASNWYPITEAMVEPMQKIGSMFYGGKEDFAMEVGRFSAESSLKGVYKLFVKFGSPGFIIGKGSQIMATYYKDSIIKVTNENSNSVTLQITKFPGMHRLIELRISGWMTRSLEICGCKNVQLQTPKSITKGNDYTEFAVKWN